MHGVTTGNIFAIVELNHALFIFIIWALVVELPVYTRKISYQNFISLILFPQILVHEQATIALCHGWKSVRYSLLAVTGHR